MVGNQFARRLRFSQTWWRHEAVQVGCVAAIMAFLTGGLHPTPYNNQILLAKAFLEGHVWIDWPGPYIDALGWNGLRYIIEGPTPALLLMPFVSIFGVGFSQTAFGIGLVAIGTGAAWNILQRLGIEFATRVWLTLFFFAGTDLWWCATLGDVWFLAHIAAVTMTMLALCELAGARRPAIVALWAALAAGSRFSLVLAIPVYALMLLEKSSFAAREAPTWKLLPSRSSQDVRRILTPFATVIALWLFGWIRYNYARWGVPFDIGYTEWYHQDAAGSPDGSPFQLRYFWYEVQSFFTNLPTVLPQAPWLRPEIIGQGLPFTSPALILAFLAPLQQRTARYFWVLTILVAAPSFLYYVDGFAQFGMRHALDFEPFLFVLMALGVRRGMPWWGAILCTYSALVGAWGVWYWHAFMGR